MGASAGKVVLCEGGGRGHGDWLGRRHRARRCSRVSTTAPSTCGTRAGCKPPPLPRDTVYGTVAMYVCMYRHIGIWWHAVVPFRKEPGECLINTRACPSTRRPITTAISNNSDDRYMLSLKDSPAGSHSRWFSTNSTLSRCGCNYNQNHHSFTKSWQGFLESIRRTTWRTPSRPHGPSTRSEVLRPRRCCSIVPVQGRRPRRP